MNNRTPSKFPLWVGFVLFTGGAIFVPDWSSSTIQQGGVIGVALFVMLCVFVAVRWNKRLSASDVRKSRHIGRSLSRGWIVGLMLVTAVLFTWLLRDTATRDFAYGALFVFAALASILGLIIAYSKKGLYQRH